MKSKFKKKIESPINQLNLFGYDSLFKDFIKLYENKRLPNTLLLSGEKGSGKATFIYHFINFLLSKNEINKYSLDNFSINSINKSYKLISANVHPNFFLLDTLDDKKIISVEQIRNLLKFTNKTTYLNSLKIVLIDNAENLNQNSANALLKTLEEPTDNTYFFIIHNSSSKILNTIKSRSTTFNIFFNGTEKTNILSNIINKYENSINLMNINKNLYFDSVGNILKYLSFFGFDNDNLFNNKLLCVEKLLDEYKKKDDPELLSFILSFIEFFYYDLSLKNTNNIGKYTINKFNIIKKIYDMKTFNLDRKSICTTLFGELKLEAK